MGSSDTLEEIPPETTAAPAWPLLTRLPAALAAEPGSRELYRSLLKQADEELRQRFFDEETIESLVHARASLIDAVLRQAWQEHLGSVQEWSLVAVGGYGRGELHPCSDIDILLLVTRAPNEAERSRIEALITFLWDIGLEVGHSVRTVAECVHESAADVSVMTTLLEARLLQGDAALLAAMNASLNPPQVWPVREFFEAKLKEQQERHLKANDTANNLEPNVKTAPGGLRDIQTIGWVAKRHFGAESLDGLARRGFISASELRRLKQAQAFLWKVRWGLHTITGRREDRLLFDHQLKLAQTFGYEDSSYTLAVEQLMQRYYRTVRDVSLLNELLLQLFREAILSDEDTTRPLNARFQVHNGSLEAIHDDLFGRNPSALLEMFVLLQQNPDIKGVRASTMRAVARSLWLIDEEFRQNPRHHRLFMEILRAPVGVTHELRRMNTYEVLGRYIPAFGRIVGRMQYDLFHAYTVDAHTLFVLSNVRRLAIPRFDHELPELSRIMQQLPKPEIIYLAALFHDIAKGRGGDHSELGAVDAEAFCLEQGLSRYDARLVAWLVKHHLELSVTAQKQDITDPSVINAFAREVGDETHLDHLYVLTCADVRGTNPKLWNSWKASLFHDFYDRVKRALRRGLESPIDQDELIRETQAQALELLAGSVSPEQTERAWARFAAPYFLRHTPEEVAWHTRLLAERPLDSDDTLVAIDPRSVRGSTAVLTFTPDKLYGFARTTAVLDQLGLTIVDARISPTGDGFILGLYHVLEDDGTPITDVDRLKEIKNAVLRNLQRTDAQLPAVSRRAPRQARMFSTATQVSVSTDERNHRSVVELVASDRPGLLSDIGKVFMHQRVRLRTAKIMTLGARAEDVFYITDLSHQPLDEEAALRLKQGLLEALAQRSAA